MLDPKRCRRPSTGGRPEKGWRPGTYNTRRENSDRAESLLGTAGSPALLATLFGNNPSIAGERSSRADPILSATRALLIW